MPELSAETRNRMRQVTEGVSTYSDKIRALDKAGYARADIARFLEKRYQHVRNVLEADARKAASALASTSEENSTPSAAPGRQRLWTKLGEGGRVLIPAEMRKALGLSEGDDLQLSLEADRLVLLPRDTVVRDIQARFAHLRDPDRSVVDEFLAERRAMWGED